MGEQIIRTGSEAIERWHQKMPLFFYWLVVIACGIGGMAFAINNGVLMLGGSHSEWWQDAYRYIIGGCIGVVFVCKFTVAGGYKRINPDKVLRNNQIVDRDSPAPNMSDVETVSIDSNPHETDTYDNRQDA